MKRMYYILYIYYDMMCTVCVCGDAISMKKYA